MSNTNISFIHTWQSWHMNELTKTVTTHTRIVQIQDRQSPLMEFRNWIQILFVIKKLFPIGAYWERETSVYFKELILSISAILRIGCMHRSGWPIQKRFYIFYLFVFIFVLLCFTVCVLYVLFSLSTFCLTDF